MSYAAILSDAPLSEYLVKKVPPLVLTVTAALTAYGVAAVVEPGLHFGTAPPIVVVIPSPIATPIPDVAPSPIATESAATPVVESIREPVRVRAIVPRAPHPLVRPLRHQRVVGCECACQHKSRHLKRTSPPIKIEAQQPKEGRRLTLLDAIANMFGPRIDP